MVLHLVRADGEGETFRRQRVKRLRDTRVKLRVNDEVAAIMIQKSQEKLFQMLRRQRLLPHLKTACDQGAGTRANQVTRLSER